MLWLLGSSVTVSYIDLGYGCIDFGYGCIDFGYGYIHFGCGLVASCGYLCTSFYCRLYFAVGYTGMLRLY